jgi:TrmH family RNA methyltransferase
MTKNEIKYYSSLLKKKFREDEKKFLAEGIKIIREGICSQNWKKRCEKVFVSNNFLTEHPEFIDELQSYSITPETVNQQEISKLTDTVTPQGIAAVFNIPEPAEASAGNLSNGLTAALESINDPGNMGTILRNCDWFGIKNVLLSPGCADIYNPKTIRSCMGSLFHLNIFKDVVFEKAFLNFKKKEINILCADLNGEDIFSHRLSLPSVIVFANEANGPSDKVLALTDKIITIKKLGNAESLNVASASAVILAELTKSF